MTLYNREGMPAAYPDKDREYIYLFDRALAAYIVEGAVYSLEGPQCGWFDRERIRNLEGYRVPFADGVRIGGPAKLFRHEMPAKWAKVAKPHRHAWTTRYARTLYKTVWPEITVADFLRPWRLILSWKYVKLCFSANTQEGNNR